MAQSVNTSMNQLPPHDTVTAEDMQPVHRQMMAMKHIEGMQRGRKAQQSVCLISAITQYNVVGTQIIDGGVDSRFFEQFFCRTIEDLREKYPTFPITVLLDNAKIHRNTEAIGNLAKHHGVNVVYLTQYSPCYNAVEQHFNKIKRDLKADQGTMTQ